MRFDYLLYDNRTLGPNGHDWGLKIATGDLDENRSVRRLFVGYCRRSFSTRVRTPRNFNAALGGFPLKEGGYVLCVTLETKDRFRRAAYGFVGIYCPGQAAIVAMLETYNPIATARSVYERERPPAQIEARGTGLIGANRLRRAPPFAAHSSGKKFAPFKKNESPDGAVAMLLGAVRSGARLPSILGIKVWASSRDLSSSEDQVVFYQGLPEEVFSKYRDRISDIPMDTSSGFAAGRRTIYQILLFAGLSVSTTVLIVFVSSWAWSALSRTNDLSTSEEVIAHNEPSGVEVPLVSRVEVPENIDLEGLFLGRVESLVMRLSAVDPEELASSDVYKLLEDVELRPECEPHRSAMRDLFKFGFSAFQASVLNTENLGHYFTVVGKNEIDKRNRVIQVRKRLMKLVPPVNECRLLWEAFALLMKNPKSLPAEWCDIVSAFSEEQEALGALVEAEVLIYICQ